MPSFTRLLHSINGKQAEAILRTRGHAGSFLVRSSNSNPGEYELSVKDGDGTISHVRIKNTGGHYYCSGGWEFAAVAELIEYYQGHKLQCDGQAISLNCPIYNDITSARWYHGSISAKQAVELLYRSDMWDTNVRDGTYLFRDSLRYPGTLVLSVKGHNQIFHYMIKSIDGKFQVQKGLTYNTIADLVKHYENNPLVSDCDYKLYLKQALNSSIFLAVLTEIEIRMKELSKKSNMEEFSHESGYFEEFEILKKKIVPDICMCEEGTSEQNIKKNRSAEGLPYDHSRVTFQNCDGKPEYINASYIAGEKLARRTYIAMQACLDDTMTDFWNMIWEQKCHVIIMLTKEVNKGQRNCTRYWPDSTTEEWELGNMTITPIAEVVRGKHVLRRFQISREGHTIRIKRDVWQYQYTAWPERGAPDDSSDFLMFLLEARDKAREFAAERPVVVHGRCGVGRTGTLIVIDIMLDLIKYHGLEQELDIMNTVHLVRSQRPGLVQTVEQYQFIYLVVHCYVETLTDQLEIARVTEPGQIGDQNLDGIDLNLSITGYVDMSKTAKIARNYNISPYEYMVLRSSSITTDVEEEDLAEDGGVECQSPQ